ncbi:MAG: GumC family protein [Gammaproteobacteria bacterium]
MGIVVQDLKELDLTNYRSERDDNEEISLQDIFHSLWLRKRLLLTVTGLLTITAALIIYQLVPRYTASAQLLIGINAAKVVNIEEVVSGDFRSDSAVIAEMEVLKSRELAHRVIDSLHLDQFEEFNPVLRKPGFLSNMSIENFLPDAWQEIAKVKTVDDRSEEEKTRARLMSLTNVFLAKLKISQIQTSRVINVTYESQDPKLAAKIANEIADKYIVGQLQAKFDATKKATDWLNDQLIELKQKVESSEHAVEQFRREHGLVEVQKNVGLSQQQFTDINSQLIIARASRVEAEAKFRQVEAMLKTGRDIGSVAEVLNSSLISSLRAQEAEMQRKYSEMQVEYGKKHPSMIQIQAELADIQKKIKSEVQKIAAVLHDNLEVARSRENSLAVSLKQMEAKISGNKQDEVQLRTLEREATANRTLFETFLSRFKETASTQGIEQADARVISYAEIPLGPSFPNTKRLLASSVIGSLCFGIVLIFGLEMLNPGVRSPEQVQELFKLSTLGIIPKVCDKLAIHDYLLQKPQSSLTEAINTLRISLSLLNPDAKVKTLLVASSIPEEGKSALALLIARHSAKSGQRVVVVDTDLRRPTIEKSLKLQEKQLGLTDLLMRQDLSLQDVLFDDEQSGMKVLSRGKTGFVNPTDLFASLRMKAIINELESQFDLIILDSPPVMVVPDAKVLTSLADKTIFVLKWDSTPRKVARSALQQLQRDGQSNIAGIVLQQVELQHYGRYGYSGSGYYYHYSRYSQYYAG